VCVSGLCVSVMLGRWGLARRESGHRAKARRVGMLSLGAPIKKMAKNGHPPFLRVHATHARTPHEPDSLLGSRGQQLRSGPDGRASEGKAHPAPLLSIFFLISPFLITLAMSAAFSSRSVGVQAGLGWPWSNQLLMPSVTTGYSLALPRTGSPLKAGILDTLVPIWPMSETLKGQMWSLGNVPAP